MNNLFWLFTVGNFYHHNHVHYIYIPAVPLTRLIVNVRLVDSPPLGNVELAIESVAFCPSVKLRGFSSKTRITSIKGVTIKHTSTIAVNSTYDYIDSTHNKRSTYTKIQ